MLGAYWGFLDDGGLILSDDARVDASDGDTLIVDVRITSLKKQFVWFENSAHTPQFDEPERFRNLLCQIRDAQQPSAHSKFKLSTDVSLSPQRINATTSVQTEKGEPQ